MYTRMVQEPPGKEIPNLKVPPLSVGLFVKTKELVVVLNGQGEHYLYIRTMADVCKTAMRAEYLTITILRLLSA